MPKISYLSYGYYFRRGMKIQKHIHVTEHNSTEADKAYWKTKSPEERMAALEFLREQYIRTHGLSQRLQRVYRVVDTRTGEVLKEYKED